MHTLSTPTPGGRTICPTCHEELIAKCGDILIWHWSHRPDSECTNSDESAWHAAWKLWAKHLGWQTEVKVANHRADIVGDNRIFELQSDFLDVRDIAAREAAYGAQLTWIYRWTPERWARLWNVGEGWFRWSRPAPSMLEHSREVVIHHRDRLYRVEAMRTDDDGEMQLRFMRGEDDKYGPVLYGSRPAPFAVVDAFDFIQQLMRQ